MPAFVPNPLIESLVRELACAAKMIENLDDFTFTSARNGASGISAHFRHNLDFVNGFLNGIEAGKIDYNRRERDTRVEQNRQYAAKSFRFAIRRLQNLPPEITEKKVSVRSEIEENLWHESSASRELEFLHSHTVHHHALVAERLESFGINVSADFGVAPSTLKFWEQRNAAQTV